MIGQFGFLRLKAYYRGLL